MILYSLPEAARFVMPNEDDFLLFDHQDLLLPQRSVGQFHHTVGKSLAMSFLEITTALLAFPLSWEPIQIETEVLRMEFHSLY